MKRYRVYMALYVDAADPPAAIQIFQQHIGIIKPFEKLNCQLGWEIAANHDDEPKTSGLTIVTGDMAQKMVRERELDR